MVAFPMCPSIVITLSFEWPSRSIPASHKVSCPRRF